MNEKIHFVSGYLNYLLKSKHWKGHGIHSPFVYEFISQVLYDQKLYPEYEEIQTIRDKLKNITERLPVSELGAGSHEFSGEFRSVKDMAGQSSVSHKFGKLLFRMAGFYKSPAIIELGTSIGLSTLYLAKGAPDSRIVTLEGNKAVCDYARSLFQEHRLKNVQAVNGLFDDYLTYLDEKYPDAGLVFIDGNHTREATLRYYHHFANGMKEGFIVIDDINWSADMQEAWETIKSESSNRVTLDLFFMGIVIFRESITPGHYVVRF